MVSSPGRSWRVLLLTVEMRKVKILIMAE